MTTENDMQEDIDHENVLRWLAGCQDDPARRRHLQSAANRLTTTRAELAASAARVKALEGEVARLRAFAQIAARVVRGVCDTTESHRRKDAVIVPSREWHRIMALANGADEARAALTERPND
jgi:hypothetical protein